MVRVLFILFVAPLIVLSPANAQSRGVHVAPVMVTLTGSDTITSVRVRNGRDAPVAFEVEAFQWTQANGADVLVRSAELLIAPGVFEVAAGGEQIVRLGVRAPAEHTERAFRILLREIPRPRNAGGLAFALEFSLPVFVSPPAARADVEARIEQGEGGPVLRLANLGAAHVQLSAEAPGAATIEAPRYLLAGASALVELPPSVRSLHLRMIERGSVEHQRTIHAPGADQFAVR